MHLQPAAGTAEGTGVVSRLRRQWSANITLRRRTPRGLTAWQKVVVFVGSGFGPGLFPVVPATFASAVMAVILFFLRNSLHPLLPRLGLTLAVTGLGLAVGGPAERVQAGKDPKWFVVDEYAGMCVVFLLNPVSAPACVLAFFFFRLFDVLKSWPAGRLEKLPGGWGIMADDLVAGVYAGIAVLAVRMVIALVYPGQ